MRRCVQDWRDVNAPAEKMTEAGAGDGILPRLSRTERSILGRLWGRQDVTQKSIVESSDLPQQTVSRVIVSLLESGFIRPGEKVGEPKRGKPSRALLVAPETGYGLGLSILADMMSLTVVDMDGQVVHQVSRQGRVPVPDVAACWVRDEYARIRRDQPQAASRLIGAGVAISGSFIDDRTFNTPVSLESWAGIDIHAWATDVFGLPVIVDNDGNAAALAEARFGVGRRFDSFAYLYLAEGIGGGVVLRGRAWRGRYGNAGEFACGLQAGVYPFPNLELLRHLLARAGHSFATVGDMVGSFDPSWPANREWALMVKDALSIIVSNAIAILDIDAVVLGGRIPAALVDEVRPHIHIFDQKRRGVLRPRGIVLAAQVDGDAAAIGAATLPVRTYLGI